MRSGVLAADHALRHGRLDHTTRRQGLTVNGNKVEANGLFRRALTEDPRWAWKRPERQAHFFRNEIATHAEPGAAWSMNGLPEGYPDHRGAGRKRHLCGAGAGQLLLFNVQSGGESAMACSSKYRRACVATTMNTVSPANTGTIHATSSTRPGAPTPPTPTPATSVSLRVGVFATLGSSRQACPRRTSQHRNGRVMSLRGVMCGRLSVWQDRGERSWSLPPTRRAERAGYGDSFICAGAAGGAACCEPAGRRPQEAPRPGETETHRQRRWRNRAGCCLWLGRVRGLFPRFRSKGRYRPDRRPRGSGADVMGRAFPARLHTSTIPVGVAIVDRPEPRAIRTPPIRNAPCYGHRSRSWRFWSGRTAERES